MKAHIFDIKRYAINDGPGIRTTLFMKGCPLRCVWCHNPEGWSPRPQLLYKQSKCIGCRSCVSVCPKQVLELTPQGIRFTPPLPLPSEGRGAEVSVLPSEGRGVEGRGAAESACTLCGRCTDECPTTALEICGREWTMDALMAEVEKERAVMEQSGGGVTLCGGEPLMHPEYTLALLRELGRRGFHRCVDTTLYAQPEVVDQVAAECELLLVDLKLMDSERHRLYTGVPNELILQNIRRIAQSGHPFSIRIPLIEGINTDEQNIAETARFLSHLSHLPSNSPKATHHTSYFLPLTSYLLPYHDVGRDKHRRMWSQYNPQNYPMSTPTDETLQRCRQHLEACGLHVVIGG